MIISLFFRIDGCFPSSTCQSIWCRACLHESLEIGHGSRHYFISQIPHKVALDHLWIHLVFQVFTTENKALSSAGFAK